jgi:hypothetical protein
VHCGDLVPRRGAALARHAAALKAGLIVLQYKHRAEEAALVKYAAPHDETG